MNKLLAGGASAAFAMGMSAATAQPAPPTPPGVAQGTEPVTMYAPHSPPIVNSPVRLRAARIDRVITRDQVVPHIRAMFAHLDSNRDGFITKDEIASLHLRMMGAHDAMAHDMAGGPMKMDHEPMRMDPGAMFDRLDTNHNGAISRREFMTGHSRMEQRRVMVTRGGDAGHAIPGMDRMGMDGMGMRMHGTGQNGRDEGMGNRLFGRADANHDGRVSLQEAEAAALAHFDRIDRNRDGRITPDERRQAHPMRDRRHG